MPPPLHPSAAEMSSAAAPLEDEDLLREILLRLPPLPSSLPRASLVCRRWRRAVSDHSFLRRFRERHARKPPLLGFFVEEPGELGSFFAPVLDPPDRVPASRFRQPKHGDELGSVIGCRLGHVLVLNWQPDPWRREFLVWDPITGHQRRVAFPARFSDTQHHLLQDAAVLCAAVDDGHVHGECHLSPFKLALVFSDIHAAQAFVCLYDSESGAWGDIVSVATTEATQNSHDDVHIGPSILVGNSLCWLLSRGTVLEFDFLRQSLVLTEKLPEVHLADTIRFLRTAGTGLGLGTLSNSEPSIRLWERKSNSDGVVGWVLQKAIQLDELFSLEKDSEVFLQGYDDCTHTVFLSTVIGDFMLQLDSMEFSELPKREFMIGRTYYPYTNIYAAARELAVEMSELKI